MRSRLLLQPDLNVTSVALDYGFGHVGRFASYYAERFGELPRNTGRGCAPDGSGAAATFAGSPASAFLG